LKIRGDNRIVDFDKNVGLSGFARVFSGFSSLGIHNCEKNTKTA
jgi:hypothetical protein